jgi:cysteine synthase
MTEFCTRSCGVALRASIRYITPASMPGPRPHALRTCESALDLIGSTPLVKLHRVSPEGTLVYAKAELLNIGGSVKDRPALRMIQAAETAGQLSSGATIVEATSGNMGISLAMICAVRGYRCVLVMPEDMTITRRLLVEAYGAKIELTPANQGMAGAVERAQQLLKSTRGAFMPSQFENPNNPLSHEQGTAQEILEQAPDDLQAFVAGVGTGGTITGVGRILKRERRGVQIVAVEPQASAVLSGKSPGLHGIQGLGAGFVPDTLDRSLLDRVVTVSDVAAQRMTRRLAREEGLLVGVSSGANVHAACAIAQHLGSGSVITVLCDTGERYLQ